MNGELPGFPPTGGAEFDQAQRRFGEDGAFVGLVELLPGLDLALAATATEVDVVGEFAEADVRGALVELIKYSNQHKSLWERACSR